MMGPDCAPPWKPNRLNCPESLSPARLERIAPPQVTVATSEPFSEFMPETLTPAGPGAREALLLEMQVSDKTVMQSISDSPRDVRLSRRHTATLENSIPCNEWAANTVATTRSLGPQHFSTSSFEPPMAEPENCSLRVVSLNLGGRNTNPLEFELKGDSSETAVEVASMLRKARRSLSHLAEGPSSMLSVERETVDEIMVEIYGSSAPPLYNFVQGLLNCETWATVIARVKGKCPDLFNALNLPTLQLKRPSVWEDPASCRGFSNTVEYLVAWKDWYAGLDRSGPFWLEDAPRTAKKRKMDIATAFAGLLLYDMMCLFSARAAMPAACADEATPEEEGRDVPFKQIAGLAAQLPSASLTARHSIAELFIRGTHVLLAQEARDFAYCPTMAGDFLPPFCARDHFTCVFLRKDAFVEIRDISEEVAKRMEFLVDPTASEPIKKSWRTSVSRLAAVWCRCLPHIGGFRACIVSLHCSKSDCTAAFVEALRDVLDEYPCDINIAGLDSNCSVTDAIHFQQRLRNAGFEVGCHPKQSQVTVAKRRTSFQTQVRKIGETDIAHKDYIVSWSPQKICRLATSYTPDLRTAYGVEQETKQCVRLPTTQWPFDHCAVATVFKPEPSCKEAAVGMLCGRRSFLAFGMVCLLLTMFLLPPLVSPERQGVYGPPGTWHTDPWSGTHRPGICEASAPCAEGWMSSGGSCYMTTPRMGYEEAAALCRESGSLMVTIGSEAENQFLAEAVCPEGDMCWIGLLRNNARNSLRWDSMELVTYTRLEAEAQTLFPLYPLSHAVEYKASILSTLPGEAEGCRWDYSFAFSTSPRSLEAGIEFAAPAVATVVSAATLLLPRPPHLLTSVYLVLSLLANTVWYLPRMWRVCFASSISEFEYAKNLGNLSDEALHTTTSFLALWIIIQRMSVLEPSRYVKRGFVALLVTCALMIGFVAAFIDTGTTLSPASPAVHAALGCKLVIFVLVLVLGAMMSRDLYHTWRLMQREAASGKSGQVSTYLTDGIRAAEYHFYSILAATVGGGLRCGALLVLVVCMFGKVYPVWGRTAWTICTLLDSISNDLCAYILASTNMDGAIVRAKGITNEVMERATMEVEQHRLAVHVLKAAPTSVQQLRHLGELENKARASAEGEREDRTFLILQSAVRVETARIHHLMLCVRLRAMTMPVRYQYLIDVPVLESAPRQHVPQHFAGAEETDAAASQYFSWLYEQAAGVQGLLFCQVNQLLASFNNTPWPSDLGLAPEQFPWTIWANGARGIDARKLLKGEKFSPGDILLHCRAGGRRLARESCYCVVLEETDPAHLRVHRSGMEAAEEVPREELRICNSGGVFIPGPLKALQRCLDKVAADYEDTVEWPPAASLTDIARCTIVVDDPYAMAVLVAYIQANMKVVRLKNRFCEDLLEPVTPEALQSMFGQAADQDAETRTPSGICSTANANGTFLPNNPQYRDISVNVEVNANGIPFVCEIQVTLSNLAILKHADQKLYSIRRMKSPRELLKSYVFSEAEPEALSAASSGPRWR